MQRTPTPPEYSSHQINKLDIEIENPLFRGRIYWARVVSSEQESLFTQYTRHTFYEIQYALRGKIGMIVGDETPLRFDESDFVIIPPDTYHQIVDSDSVGARFIMAFSLEARGKEAKALLKALASPIPHRESPHMRSLLSLILDKSPIDDPLCREEVNALVSALLLEVLGCISPPMSNPLPAGEGEEKIRVAEEIIREHGGIGITVSSLASRLSLTERHLSRLFSVYRGYPTKEAIHREKMKKIEELILSSGLSFCEISELSGFSDEYAMHKFFRRRSSISPSEFRRLGKRSGTGQG